MTNGLSVVRVLVTGSNGLLGYHARAALLAENCGSDFKQTARKYEWMDSPRLHTSTRTQWIDIAANADLVLHLAGINRAEPEIVEHGNIAIALCLVDALRESGSKAHIIYANSTHAGTDSPYGRGKQGAHELFDAWSVEASVPYTNMVLPHIFGETARPHYNNVTATLCSQVVNGSHPTIHDGAKVELLHAGAVIDAMLHAFDNHATGTHRLAGKPVLVEDLYAQICSFKAGYESNLYPDLSDSFTVALFNTYRAHEYPGVFPRHLQLHEDERGTLFEAVKGGGGGQTFLSWTKPGVERGNHFHRHKVERFLVVSGEAEIRIRAVFGNSVDRFKVSGREPVFVDIPTLHTHSIVNTGSEPLLTLFWAHEVFDPQYPDTYAHPVLL